jgi:Imm-5 like putative immunity protein
LIKELGRQTSGCCPPREADEAMDHEAGRMTLSEEDRRFVGLWAADCAERVLPLFEAKAPADARPREAIEGIRGFARGGKRTARLRSLAWAAHAAAREVGDPVATAAARAASLAAATAYVHALATPHQAKHVLGPAVYGARARELAAVDDPSVGEEEIRWAIERASPTVREVVQRMPARSPGRSRLDALLYQLDAGLRR